MVGPSAEYHNKKLLQACTASVSTMKIDRISLFVSVLPSSRIVSLASTTPLHPTTSNKQKITVDQFTLVVNNIALSCLIVASVTVKMLT